MILNLVPEFLDVLAARDREAAYQQYLRKHRSILSHYWHNCVIDLDAAPAAGIARAALEAGRADLLRLVESCDLDALAARAADAAARVLAAEQELDVCLMVGVGAANAAELVVEGRGVVVICVEHFTGHANPETFGLGLAPELMPLWIAHAAAHLVRCTAATSRADIRRLIAASGGNYQCWELASRASLRELLVNEGISVHASRAAAPGFPEEAYFGYSRRQYRRLRELETFLLRGIEDDLDSAGLGLRLRYLTGGMAPAARLVRGRVLPERSGYYLGARLAEALVTERGVAEAARATAGEFADAESRRQAGQAASA